MKSLISESEGIVTLLLGNYRDDGTVSDKVTILKGKPVALTPEMYQKLEDQRKSNSVIRDYFNRGLLSYREAPVEQQEQVPSISQDSPKRK